jgi:hypothetical protein
MPKKGDRSWSDEQLRAAVTASTTYVGVCKQLGLSASGGCHSMLQARVRALGLDTSHFMQVRRPFTDEQLHVVVPACTTYMMVVERLGLEPFEESAKLVRRRIGQLGIATDHFLRRRDASGRRSRWSDDDLRAAVAASPGYAATLRALGLIPAGGNYDRLQRRIRELGIDTSHFTGQGWNKGGKFVPRPARPLEEVLVAGQWTASHNLKERLLRAGLKKAECELCGWAQRAPDGRIPIELDHMNGDKNDNRLVNLRILCPNCHSLQPTHRGLNQKRRKNS